jgi:hypothetical protein
MLAALVESDGALDRTHVPNQHIIMRRAVTLRQPSASTSSILIWGSVWGFPSIIEISVRKFKIKTHFRSSLLIVSEHTEHTIIQIRNLLFLNISLKKRALQIGLPRDIDGPMKIQMASDFI